MMRRIERLFSAFAIVSAVPEGLREGFEELTLVVLA
jgi:hypothetical protein